MWRWMVVLACGGSPVPEADEVAPEAEEAAAVHDAAAAVAAALAHPARPGDDRARDPDRRPAEVLDFLGFAPGMVVADLMTGRGYYAEILGRAVGPEGRVYAQNNRYVLDKFAEAPLAARLAKPGLADVVKVDAELEDLGLPEGGVDLVWMGLFFHDMYWMQADRKAMLAAIFGALEPGGVFGLSDHHAAQGRGAQDVKSLHRVERQLVIDEVTAAGFVLEADSDLLRHPEDDRTTNVFDEGIRGRTDRFLVRFRKPAE